jgi:uncharacterized protein (TIGR03435 family)
MKHAATLVVCILLGSQAAWNQPANPAFEVVSVKVRESPPGMSGLQVGGPSPLHISGNRVTTSGTLATFVMAAYKLRLYQVTGGPQWTDREGNPLLFDIQAEAEGVLVPDQARQMFQTLLADRFHLQFHQETREMPAYELTVDKNRAKLKGTTPGTESNSTSVLSHGVWKFTYTNFSMGDLATRIASNFDQPLLDKTGVQGGYDFTMEYRRVNPNMSAEESAAMAQRGNTETGPTIYDALEQLGLKVIHTKGPVAITVIDRAEMPSGN